MEEQPYATLYRSVLPLVDRFDPLVAASSSIILHLLALAILLSSSLAGSSGFQTRDGIGLHTSGLSSISSELDFRQRLVHASAFESASIEDSSVQPLSEVEAEAAVHFSQSATGSDPIKPSDSEESENLSVTASSDQAVISDVSSSSADLSVGSSAHAQHDSLRGSYLAALRAAILKRWNQPDHVINDCVVELQLRPGGELAGAKISYCSLDAGARNQLEAAALMAQPLPYQGYEAVFSDSLNLKLSQ